ncbi:MAG TPA: hypothetical protein VN775_04595 [Opitutaceae bacterium]|nr:hypothetical protein [Opitutaceae bacterium]
MSGFPGSPRILKGAFVRYDTAAASPKIIVFPFNPETLNRIIVPSAQPPPPGPPNAATGSPLETIVFTLTLDATDALEQGNAQAASLGVYPVLSAIELLMYPPLPGLTPVTLFVWGPSRIIPVRVVGLNILESLFDPNLSPIQATVQVTLTVAPPGDTPSLGYLLQHVSLLNGLAGLGYSTSPTGTGIMLPAPGSKPPSAGIGTGLGSSVPII